MTKLDTSEEFDSLAEWWADLARSDANPERRAKKFADLRERYKTPPNALRSFAPERENLRAKRDIYDLGGGDVIGRVYDEEIPALLAEKGRGYYGTKAYYIEMKGMTQEAAEKRVAKDELFKKAIALRDQDRTIDPSLPVEQLAVAIANYKKTQGEIERLWKDWESS